MITVYTLKSINDEQYEYSGGEQYSTVTDWRNERYCEGCIYNPVPPDEAPWGKIVGGDPDALWMVKHVGRDDQRYYAITETPEPLGPADYETAQKEPSREEVEEFGSAFIAEVRRLIRSGALPEDDYSREILFGVAIENIANRWLGRCLGVDPRQNKEYKNLKRF